jgi:hypothetical protein
VAAFEGVPAEVIAELEDILSPLSDSWSIQVIEGRPRNAIELGLGEAVALYLVFRTVDGFFGEIGADFYHALKDACVRTMRALRGKQAAIVTPSRVTVLPHLSVIVQVDSRPQARFVFPSDMDEGPLLQAVDELPEAINGAIEPELFTSNSGLTYQYFEKWLAE